MQRNTVQRGLVLEATRNLRGRHPTADDVYEYLHRAHPSISKATVYRNLAILDENGDILRLKIPGGADRYDTPLVPHVHLHCLCCGAVADVDLPELAQTAQTAARRSGYRIDTDDVVLEGLCPACKQS